MSYEPIRNKNGEIIRRSLTFDEMNEIRNKSASYIQEFRRKITAEQAISMSNWDKESSWGKLLRIG